MSKEGIIDIILKIENSYDFEQALLYLKENGYNIKGIKYKSTPTFVFLYSNKEISFGSESKYNSHNYSKDLEIITYTPGNDFLKIESAYKIDELEDKLII